MGRAAWSLGYSASVGVNHRNSRLPGLWFLVARREFDTAIVVVDPGSEFLVICFEGFVLNGSNWCRQPVLSRIGLASLWGLEYCRSQMAVH